MGAYSPRWFMSSVHCDPRDAVDVHKDLRSKKSVGMHWGTSPHYEWHLCIHVYKAMLLLLLLLFVVCCCLLLLLLLLLLSGFVLRQTPTHAGCGIHGAMIAQ